MGKPKEAGTGPPPGRQSLNRTPKGTSHRPEVRDEMFARLQVRKTFQPVINTFDSNSLLNNLPGIAYRCRNDSDWTMEFISHGCTQLTGYKPEDLISNHTISFQNLIHPDDQGDVRRKVEQALAENRPFDIIYRIRTRSGGTKWVREMGQAIPIDHSGLLLEGFITDITDVKHNEQQIISQMERFQALRRIDMAINASLDLRVTLDILLDQVMMLLHVDAADVLLFNPITQLLEFSNGRGFRDVQLQKIQLRIGDSFAGTAGLEKRPILIPDFMAVKDRHGQSPSIAGEQFASYFAVPLIAKGQVKGVLEVFQRRMINPNKDWIDFLEALAGQAAIAVDNATLFNELQRSNIELARAYEATLEGWSKALELRDQETQGHTKRVTDTTIRLAIMMNVPEEMLIHIRRGALLHDIGKMGIPDSILLKPGPLTEEEWVIMRQHPVYAFSLLTSIANLNPALEIPYSHHEKWDGSGYPQGLKGEQIPMAARIFAVVDVWDALRSDRPYRSAWPDERVIEYIRSESGKHFDPRVVENFLKLLNIF
jgi:PAS domain S-box-containing protein